MGERRWEVGICGTFDVASYGDLLYPLIAESELSARLGPVTLHRFSYNARTPPGWPYEVTPVTELPRMIQRLDGLLIGGGFLIRFDKQIAPGYLPPTPEIHHPTGYWLTPALMALQHNVPLIWNAPGMHCNEIPAWAHPLMEMALTNSGYVSVRDELSRAALAPLASAPVAVVPDTAFRLPRLFPLEGEPSAEFRRLAETSGLDGPYIIVQATLGLEGFVRFLRNHEERLRSFRFLALPISPALGERSEIIDADLSRVIRLLEWPSPLVMAELIGRSEAAIGHSYHLMITSLAAGVPVFTRQNLSTGKYSALQHFETIFGLPTNGEPDLEWFLDHVGRTAPSEAARATHAPLAEHWDRIVAALKAEKATAAPRLNRFWQTLPALLEDASKREEAVVAALANERAGARERQTVLESQLAGLRSALLRAEEIRQLTLHRCLQFRTAFEEQVAVYRGQRAWKLMLWCRKAYTLFFSSPVLGKVRFLRFSLTSLFGRRSLSDQELSFPSLPAYLPQEAMDPFTTLAGSMEASASAVPAPLSGDSPPPLLPRARKYDVVILGIIDFDFRFQRPQQMAVRFAREGHRVFWISPARFLAPSSSLAYQLLDLRENLWEVHLRGQPPDIFRGSLEADAARGFQDVLCQFYREAGIVESCACVQLPFWRQLALGLRASFGATVLYDCMDNWETFPNFGAFNLSEERLLASDADVLVVTAQRLVEKFQRQGLQPLLVRNAADYESFARASGEPEWLRKIPRPIVGYFGAIADWMDLALVDQVATSRPGYSFVLIGTVFSIDVSRLQALPNVHLVGHKEYSEMPSCLSGFDACIIPFLVNQVTNATDPVKLYEYFSQGKPVVATAMAELEACGDLAYIARSATEFEEMLDRALGEEKNSHLSRRRMEFARSNTWGHRYAAVHRAIAGTFPEVSILIVTHNSAEFLQPCLDSILRNTAYPDFEIIVVDNASQDETPSVVQRYAADHHRVKGFCFSENRGFAAGNNRAARHASGEYLVFLNPDTLVTAGWLEHLMRHARKDATIGLLTPVTNFAGNETRINVDYENQAEMEEFAACRTRQHWGRLFELKVAPLYCALMPRPVWERVGYLDERFGIGMFEDDDLSWRVRAAGFRVVGAEDCFVHHFGQGAFSKLDAREYQRIFDQNRRQYERKWHTTWQPHHARDGVRPVWEEERFHPASFCGGDAQRPVGRAAGTR